MHKMLMDSYSECEFCEIKGRMEPGFKFEVLCHYTSEAGVPYLRSTTSSLIEDITHTKNDVIVTTKHNIYTFTLIKEKEEKTNDRKSRKAKS